MNNSANLAKKSTLATHDPVWHQLLTEAKQIATDEPKMCGFIHENILNQPSLEDAVVNRIAERLAHKSISASVIRLAYSQAIETEPEFSEHFRIDIVTVVDRDPICDRAIEPVLYFKGFHAIQTHRLANWLWHNNQKDFALYLQSRASEIFQVDIHPGVPMGKGIFFDHGTGIVIGGTAVIEDDVSILQGVTLGGTGKDREDRHPKIRQGVLIGAGANVLGNIEIGQCSKVAAGSVVLNSVPPETTVAGVPAKIVGKTGCSEPARSMDQLFGNKS